MNECPDGVQSNVEHCLEWKLLTSTGVPADVHQEAPGASRGYAAGGGGAARGALWGLHSTDGHGSEQPGPILQTGRPGTVGNHGVSSSFSITIHTVKAAVDLV